MEHRLRNVPHEAWKQFKILCIEEEKSINSKLIELVMKELARAGKLKA